MKSRREPPEPQSDDPLDGIPEFVRAGSRKGAQPRSMLSLVCSRCGGGFFVVERRWKQSKYKTRPCPYCFKVSKP